MVVSKALYYSVVDIGIADLRVVDPLMLTFTSEQERSYHALQEWCQSNSVLLCTADDEQYHFKFRQVYSPPYVLTMIGDSELLHRELLAVVGPRRVSDYGKSVVKKLFESVQYYDLVTISGLADGVDMLCHQYSLDKRIPTIAVLGFGLRWALRSAHREMIRAIVDAGGLVISEFQLDQGPQRYTFPQRNRIVAGLANMVFVPEASHKSGSLITIDFAQKMHKEVYGAPGSIFSDTFRGLGEQMQLGVVRPVIDMDSMLDRHFGRLRSMQTQGLACNEVVDNPIVMYIQKNPVGHSVNELAYQTGLDIEEIMSHLTMAEVLGQISQRDGKRYYK